MKAILSSICLLTLASLVRGQEQPRVPTPSKSPSQQITSGGIENGRYSNSFFNFSIAIPGDWESMTNEEYSERLRNIAKLAAKQNSQVKQELAAGPSAIPTILRLSPKNYRDGKARAFAILAQDLSGHPAISPEEYLNQSKEAYSHFQGMNGGFGPIYHIQCKGGDLTACDLTTHEKSSDGYTTFAVISRRGYLLSFVLGARGSEAHKQVKEILNTLTFD